MTPGGGHGGVKPLVYSFLAEISRQRGPAFNWVFVTENALRSEIEPLLRRGDFFLERSETGFSIFQRDERGLRDAGKFSSSADIQAKAGLDVIYAPFGVSPLMRPDLPCISLIVDVLHRDFPEALPIEEVNHRHQWFTRVVAEATYIQCISRHVVSRLQHHYGVHPARCFHTYIPVQNRLPTPAADVLSAAGAPEGPYFFYPANFWPHKNHETLLVAYRQYAHAAASRAWPLVFTGFPDDRATLLEEMRDGLGLRDNVHFLGHLDNAAFATLWARAGALVFPSLHEGFGIPLLEAMRFGVPILAANATSLPEVGGDACLYVDPSDPRLIADALRRLAIREGLREDLVNRGRARLGAFSLEVEAERLAHFLESAARKQVP
jgi:glycosyltransferase involved in cell wall biosynthesis